MAPRARTAASLVWAAAWLMSGGRAATAGVVEHDTIQSGDTVLGDLLAPRDLDVYDFEGTRGATVTISAVPVAPGRWLGRTIGVVDAGYTRALGSVGISPTQVRTEPLTASGTWHLAVGTADTRLGGYKVRLSVAPARSFVTAGTGAVTPSPFVIGAPAGAELTVSLRWRGPSPVTLDAAQGITDPDGNVVVSGTAPKSKGSSSRQSGFRVTTAGDHAVRFVVPAGTKSWTAKISLKLPRPARGTTRDLRTVGAPPEHTVTLVDAGEFVAIRIAGETGGPNDILLLPTSPQLGQGSANPIAVGIDGRGSACAAFALDRSAPPGTYRFVCSGGSTAEMRDIVRTADRIVAFEAPSVRSPAGTGSVSVTGVVYDASLAAVAWTETRTFDATGHVHVLDVSGVARRANGGVTAYTVVHTGPDGTGGTYEYAPLQTR